MKRIILMCIAMMFALSGLANAEITKEKDETGLRICSTKQISYTNSFIETVSFYKHIVSDEVFYRLTISTKTPFAEWLIRNSAVSISIDKYPKFYLNDYHYSNNKRNYASVEAVVSLDIIDKISKARSSYILADGEMGGIIDIDPILSEWKEVINTTE